MDLGVYSGVSVIGMDQVFHRCNYKPYVYSFLISPNKTSIVVVRLVSVSVLGKQAKVSS
jgi:hypothetical protein